MSQIRRFGPPPGGAGVVLYERTGINQIPDPLYGTTFFVGVLKRGPMGVAVPIRSRKQYEEIYSDPADPRFHLFEDASHLTPDAIDGFFSTSGGAGTVFITRLDVDGKARVASRTFKGRNGVDVLKIKAANEGRWGGYENMIASTPVIFATSRTFTLVAAGTQLNEFKGAIATFSGAPGQEYVIVSNTAADPRSGETIFTVASQFDLIEDGVSGPLALTGTATYSIYKNITGTIAFPLLENLTGTASINDRVIVGTGTQFSTQLRVGQNVYYAGEARVIQSITSDTTLTIDQAFSMESVSGVTLQRDNVTVTGTLTAFTTELAVGQKLYVLINGEIQGRTIASITSATELKLESGYTMALTAGTQAQRENYEITGTGTSFNTQLSPGQYIVDPNRAGATVQVVTVSSATSVIVDRQFSKNFTDAQLTKQPQTGAVELTPESVSEGLAIEIGQGLRKPDTHFTITVFFNGSQILQIPDCSLDPADPDFVETKVVQSNIAHADGTRNYCKWIEAESLWTSAYTTAPSSDVRPTNGAGPILHLKPTQLYTVVDLEYDRLEGQRLYPSPYELPRGYYTITGAKAPIKLAGTTSSTGTTVTGTSTTFTSQVKAGDYLYDPNTKVVRRVRLVQSNTSLLLDTAFPVDMPALTKAIVSGYVMVGERHDLTLTAAVGDTYMISHPQSLKGGYDGNTAVITPWYYSKYADSDDNFIEKAVLNRNLGLVKIATPGISDTAIQKQYAYYASQKAFEYRAEIPSYINSSAVAESFVNQQLGRNDFISLSFPSYGVIANPLGGGDRLVPLSGEILGGEAARAVAARGYHTPFAGTSALLPRVLKLPVLLDLNDEAILNLAGIQPVKFLDGNAVVWGVRCPSISESYKFLHIRRIQSNYVRVLIENRNLMELIFMPNQPGLLDQVILMLDQFARREYNKGVLSQYLNFEQAVQVNSDVQSGTVIAGEDSRNSLVEIINGQLNIYFRYVPTGVLEVLSVNVGPDLLVEEFGQTVGNS